MAKVPAVWIGSYVAQLARDTDASDGLDPYLAVPGGNTVAYVPTDQIEENRNWVQLGYTDSTGTFVTVVPSMFGVDSSDQPYVDISGPAPGETAALELGWETIPASTPTDRQRGWLDDLVFHALIEVG